MERRHESFEHTADTGIRAYASDLAGLFEEAATAMFEVMYAGRTQRGSAAINVAAAAATTEELLVAWLSELLYIAEANHLALDAFHVDEITADMVRGRTGGSNAATVVLDGPPVKAVTYHGLEVTHTDDGWSATVIFDV